MVKRTLGTWALVAICVIAVLGFSHAAAQDTGRVFAETGQSLDDQYGFLQFWEQHQGATLFGPPITPVVVEDNIPVQYFERGRLEQREGNVFPGSLGRERTRWRTFPAMRPHVPQSDERVFAETSHAVGGAFYRFWQNNDGALLFGAPLSEPLWEMVDGSSILVQYFERARLERLPRPGGDAIVVSDLGREIALAKGLLTPAQQPAVAILDESVTEHGATFAQLAPPTPTPIPPTPTPVPPTMTPAPPTATPAQPKQQPQTPPKPTATPPAAKANAVSGKVVEVNLSTQRLAALEDGVVVYRAPIATGKDGFNTPTGSYTIYAKQKLRTMRGTLNGETWVVPNVPNVMYFNGMVALHGTYWHNMFGTGVRMSHGCVNLSLADAEWLYGWTSVGTTVVVHY